MVTRKTVFRLFLFALCLGASLPAHADDRTAALLGHFERFCVHKAPSFDRLNQAAAKFGWHVHTDRTPNLPDGQAVHSKSWMLKDDTGPYELGISINTDGGKHSESCGIGVSDVAADAMRDELVKTLKLGEPEKQTDSADGQRSLTFWKTNAGETPVTIMFTHDKAEGSKGLFLSAYTETGGG